MRLKELIFFILAIFILLSISILITILFPYKILMIIVLISLSILISLISILIAVKKKKALTDINRKIEEINEESLSYLMKLQFDIPSDDEIGKLAQNLNVFLSIVRKIFIEMKNNFIEDTRITKELETDIKLTLMSYIQKVVNIGNVKVDLEQMYKKINESTGATKQILDSITELADQAKIKAESAEQFSEVLKKVFNSINLVTDISKEKHQLSGELNELTEKGSESMDNTLTVISDMSESTSRMFEAIDFIKNISSQTNLLSMNAAIEATHAGDYGKGFAVIAEEINNLAESTAISSVDINKGLKNQAKNISFALERSNESGDIFGFISKKVLEVTGALSEIASNMDDMSQNTNHLKTTMQMMSDVIDNVKETSTVMQSGIQNINTMMIDLDEISSRTIGILGRITITNEEAQEATLHLFTQLDKMKALISQLNSYFDHFFLQAKKVFFLYPDNMQKELIKGLFNKEYEVYPVENHLSLPKLLMEYKESLVFVNFDKNIRGLDWMKFIKDIKGNKLIEDVVINILSYKSDPLVNSEYFEAGVSGFIELKEDPLQCRRIITKALKINEVNGRRQYIRVDLDKREKSNKCKIIINDDVSIGQILDLNSVALRCSFDKALDIKKDQNHKEIELFLIFSGDQFKVPLKKIETRQKTNTYVCFFESDKIEPDVKEKISSFIYDVLQAEMKKKLKKLK